MRLVNTGLGRLGAFAHAFCRKKAARRITAGVLALSMVLTNVGFSALAAPGDETQPEQATDSRVADPGTLDGYKDFLDMSESTENAGRVWSDKSVFADKAVVDGHTYESSGGNYVEVFSAMGSSQQYTGAIPSKTVIVFDNSGSMYSSSKTWSQTRIAQTVASINSTIDRLMRANPYNEVSVVLFGNGENNAFNAIAYEEEGKITVPHHGNSTAVTIIPMGHYEYNSSGNEPLEYLLAGWTAKGPMGNKLEQTTSSGSGWVFVDHNILGNKTANGCDYTAYSNGTTNIQAGIYRGLQELYNAEPSKDEAGVTLHYIPSMLILTDGQATDCLTGGWTERSDSLEAMGFVNDFGSEFVSFTGWNTLGGDQGAKWNQFITPYEDDRYHFATIGGEPLSAEATAAYQAKIAYDNAKKEYDDAKKTLEADPENANLKDDLAEKKVTLDEKETELNTAKLKVLPYRTGLQRLEELSAQYRSTEGYMVLGALVTASYWQNQVEEKFGRDCNIYTISVDMPDPESSEFTLALDETTGKAKDTSKGKITTNGPMMNPGVCFNKEWLKKYFVNGNLESGETIYPENTIGSQRVLGILDAIKGADELKTSRQLATDNLSQYRPIKSGGKPSFTYSDGTKETIDTFAKKDMYIKDYAYSTDSTGRRVDSPLLSHGDFWQVDAVVQAADRQAGSNISGLNLNYVKKAFYASSTASATTAINSIFDEIVTMEQKLAFNPISPVQVEENGQTNPNSVLTYTDPIGKYMEVKSVDKLLLFGQEYTFGEPEQNTDGSKTYKLTSVGSTPLDSMNSIIKNEAYTIDQEFDVRGITATVKKDAATGTQELKIIVPGRALPIRVADLSTTIWSMSGGGSTTSRIVRRCQIHDTTPLRVIYKVGLVDDIKLKDGSVDLNKVDETYKSENQDGNGGVNFYTNMYTKGSGDAKTEFTPSKDNRYYNPGDKYFVKNGNYWEERPDERLEFPKVKDTTSIPRGLLLNRYSRRAG